MNPETKTLPLTNFGVDFTPIQQETTLYIIEKRTNGVWELLERGKLNTINAELTQADIDAVYTRYSQDKNYRIVVYGSSISNFPNEVLEQNISELQEKVENLKIGIQIAKSDGFAFHEYISQTTGLVLEEILSEETNNSYMIFMPPFRHSFACAMHNVQITRDELNSPLSTEVFLAALQLTLANWEDDLIDLKHRQSTKNKRNCSEVISSIWHKSDSFKNKEVYHLEFVNGDPCFRKYQLVKTNELDVSICDKTELYHKPIYLQHGDDIYTGKPISNFGWLKEIHNEKDQEKLDFKFNDFVQNINEIEFQTDFLGGLYGGTKSYVLLVDFCKKYYSREPYDLDDVLQALYGEPHYLLDDSKIRENPPRSGALNYVEDRQRLNNIWNVI